jgi:pimeloyl-ACP methyl ester carboxylesterase
MLDRLRVVLFVLIAFGPCACATSDEPGPGGATAEQPTAGRVDVGGYELAWMCRGSNSPTIIAEAGYDSAGTDTWFDLLGPLSRVSRVCTYDRAGTGTSNTRPNGVRVTGMSEAEELHRLLQGAGIEPPYVVVGHSYGGFISRLFAARYPDETAGLVLVDSSHEDEIHPYRRYYGDAPEGDWVDGGDLVDIDATARALRETARDFGDLPLAVVKAGQYEDVLTTRLWRRTQADLATLSSNSVFVQATGGHFVMNDDPAVLVTAVRAVVESARSGEPIASCERVIEGTDGTCPDDPSAASR